MSQRLFGTDGIRGVANVPPLTPDLAYRVGRELVATLAAQRADGARIRLVIGRDTRRSGPLLEAAMVAGLLSAGADCYTVGVLPTPGIALLTRALRVVAKLRGSPPADVQVGRVVVEPSMVQVKGPRTTIEEHATVETAPVDVTDLRQSITRTVGLQLPDSVYPTTQRTVQVTIEVRRDR